MARNWVDPCVVVATVATLAATVATVFLPRWWASLVLVVAAVLCAASVVLVVRTHGRGRLGLRRRDDVDVD